KPVPAKVCPLTLVCRLPCGFSLEACDQPSCCEPGDASTSAVKLRLNNGRSSTALSLKTVATSARSVLSCGVSAVTSTVSVDPPTWNCPSTRAAVSAETPMPLATNDLKPEAVTWT